MHKNEVPATAKKGLFRIIFSRTGIILLLILVQLIWFLRIPFYLGEYSRYMYGVMLILEVVVVIYIINSEDNPAFKMTWMLFVVMLPLMGAFFYIFVKTQMENNHIKDRLSKLKLETAPYLRQDEAIVDALWASKSANANLAYYLSKRVGFPVYRNTEVKYFPLGEDKFRQMVSELRNARKFIFMEYFIVEEGYMWDTILDILIRKAGDGVEVRFMYDGMCSLALLPWGYPKKMEAKGIRCQAFAPIRPMLSTYQNNRDHRKIVVIDGRVAFTGGINLADEYINKKPRFGYWKDTAVMVKGDAVKSFTVMFLQNWNIWEKQAVPCEKYLVSAAAPSSPGQGFVMPYGDTPLDHETVGKYVYMDILSDAKEYVHIMTPYLILDDEMIGALIFAAKRGVEVVIIMPHIPDKKYAFFLAHTYYQELLDGGVKIWEFTPGFVHAKVFTSDGEKAVVGTINLDFRSLYHHFECAAYMYRNQAVADVEADFRKTLEQCREITRETCRSYPFYEKVAGRGLRLIAPLM